MFCTVDAGEQVERHQLVVRVGRGDGQSVQRGGAVAVTQSADDKLSGAGDGDTRYFLYSFFHIADAFEGHLFGTEVLDGEGRFLPFHLQGRSPSRFFLAVTCTSPRV